MESSNKYGEKEVLNVMVFDEKGNFVTELDTLCGSKIYTYQKNGSFRGKMILKDSLRNFDLMNFIYKDDFTKESITDFDKCVDNLSQRVICVKSIKKDIPCKLIAFGIIRNVENGTDEKYRYEIRNALITNDYMVDLDGVHPDDKDIVIDIEPDNELCLFKIVRS